MEKKSFRDNLFLLNERYPNKMWFNIKEVCEVVGISRNTVIKRYPKIQKEHGCSIAELARLIS